MTIAVLNATRSPRDLETFTKKVADGKKATTDFLTAEEFFKHLPGWQVERVIAPLLVKDDDRATYGLRAAIRDAPEAVAATRRALRVEAPYYNNGSFSATRDTALALEWLNANGRLRVVKDTPATLAEGHMAVTQFTPIPSGVRDYYAGGFSLGRVWIGRVALRVTAPSVKATGRKAPENPLLVFDDPKDAGVFGLGSFWTWAKNTTIAADAKALLESLRGPPETEEARAEREDRERIGSLDQSGVCAVCFRKQKFHGERRGLPLMYDHGYQIPPGGSWTDNGRVGSCSGVGLPPYEVSAYGTKKTLDRLTDTLKGLRESREKLNHATMIARTEEKRDSVGNTVYERDERGQYRRDRNYSRIPVMEQVEYTPSHPKWARVLATAIAQVEAEIRMVTGQVEFYTEKVKNWQRVPTYDERQAGKLLYRDAFAR